MVHLHRSTEAHNCTSNCTVAVDEILHFNDKFYDFLAKFMWSLYFAWMRHFDDRQILKIVLSSSQSP